MDSVVVCMSSGSHACSPLVNPVYDTLARFGRLGWRARSHNEQAAGRLSLAYPEMPARLRQSNCIQQSLPASYLPDLSLLGVARAEQEEDTQGFFLAQAVVVLVLWLCGQLAPDIFWVSLLWSTTDSVLP